MPLKTIARIVLGRENFSVEKFLAKHASLIGHLQRTRRMLVCFFAVFISAKACRFLSIARMPARDGQFFFLFDRTNCSDVILARFQPRDSCRVVGPAKLSTYTVSFVKRRATERCEFALKLKRKNARHT